MSVEVMTDLNAALVAAGDSASTRTVYAVVIALGLIGVALLILGIWLIKQTKPEPELLAPLERMDDRAWRKQEPAQMRRDLDSLRPDGARPLSREKSVPDVDADFAQQRPTLGSFDDLQAQSAADARRASSGANDPLLAPRDESEEQTAENDSEGDVTDEATPDEAAAGSAAPNTIEPDDEQDDTGEFAVDEFDVSRAPTNDS